MTSVLEARPGMCLATESLSYLRLTLLGSRNQSAAGRDKVATGLEPSEVNQDAKRQLDRLDRRVCKVRAGS